MFKDNSEKFYTVLGQDLVLKFTTKILPLKRKTYIFAFLSQLLNISITNAMFVHKKFYQDASRQQRNSVKCFNENNLNMNSFSLIGSIFFQVKSHTHTLLSTRHSERYELKQQALSVTCCFAKPFVNNRNS